MSSIGFPERHLSDPRLWGFVNRLRMMDPVGERQAKELQVTGSFVVSRRETKLKKKIGVCIATETFSFKLKIGSDGR